MRTMLMSGAFEFDWVIWHWQWLSRSTNWRLCGRPSEVKTTVMACGIQGQRRVEEGVSFDWGPSSHHASCCSSPMSLETQNLLWRACIRPRSKIKSQSRLFQSSPCDSTSYRLFVRYVGLIRGPRPLQSKYW